MAVESDTPPGMALSSPTTQPPPRIERISRLLARAREALSGEANSSMTSSGRRLQIELEGERRDEEEDESENVRWHRVVQKG